MATKPNKQLAQNKRMSIKGIVQFFFFFFFFGGGGGEGGV